MHEFAIQGDPVWGRDWAIGLASLRLGLDLDPDNSKALSTHALELGFDCQDLRLAAFGDAPELSNGRPRPLSDIFEEAGVELPGSSSAFWAILARYALRVLSRERLVVNEISAIGWVMDSKLEMLREEPDPGAEKGSLDISFFCYFGEYLNSGQRREILGDLLTELRNILTRAELFNGLATGTPAVESLAASWRTFQPAWCPSP